jgi:hypothetical protein
MSNAYASWEHIAQLAVFKYFLCRTKRLARTAPAPGVNFLKHPWTSESRELPHEYPQVPVPSWVISDFACCIEVDTHFQSAKRLLVGITRGATRTPTHFPLMADDSYEYA